MRPVCSCAYDRAVQERSLSTLDRRQDKADEALAEMGALAASITALEPDLQVLASRVRWALSIFEERFEGDEPSVIERYELDRYSMGAAALYDAVVDLSELLMNAVAGLGRQVHRTGRDFTY